MTTRTSRWRQAWHDFRPGEKATAYAWLSFATTFGVTRGITHAIRSTSSSGGGGVTVAGMHLHHYNFGIAGLSAVGALAIRRDHPLWTHPVGPILYGAANALIADEAALLLNLKDVYWGPRGRLSVDAAVTGIGLGAVAVAAMPVARALRGHEAEEARREQDRARPGEALTAQ